MSNRLQELLSGSIRDVIVQETQERVQSVVQEVIPQVNQEDFTHQEIHTPIVQPYIEAETVSEYTDEDAESNAISMVNGLGLLTATIVAPIAIYKTKKRAGGKKVMDAMRKAYIKKMNGGTLNETEQNLLVALADYERKMELLSDTYLMSSAEKESLLAAAKHYCKESEIKIGAGLGFWSEFAGITIAKVLKIVS